MRWGLFWVGLFGLTGVGAGALGAHALKGSISEGSLEVFKTAVFYQLVHTLALWLSLSYLDRFAVVVWSARLFGVGIVLFSGSLYLLALTDWTWPGPITPLGGLAFMAGWLLLALFAWRVREGET